MPTGNQSQKLRHNTKVLHQLILAAAATVLAVVGCGGGGGSDSAGVTLPPPEEKPSQPLNEPLPPDTPLLRQPTPAGVWEGTGPDGRAYTAVVVVWLDDGYHSTANVFYSAADNSAVMAGFISGRLVQEDQLPVEGGGSVDFNFEGGGATPARLDADVGASGDSLDIKVYTGSRFKDVREVLSLAYNPRSRDVPVPANIAGHYAGELFGEGGAQHFRFAIDSSGTIASSGGGSCEAAGRISPYPFQYIYSVEMTFSGSSCAYPGQTVYGTGIYDPDKNQLLLGWADNQSPDQQYGLVFAGQRAMEADLDGDGLIDREDTDDDNDGVPDTDDDCPWDANRGCPYTVSGQDREWLQPVDFSGLTWTDIDAVCPAAAGGSCSGILRGREMNGWTWASAEDVLGLFAAYGFPTAPPGVVENFWSPAILPDTGHAASLAWEQAGWRPTSTEDCFLYDYCYFQFLGYTRDWPAENDAMTTLSVPSLRIYPDWVSGENHRIGQVRELTPAETYGVNGAWFYRIP